MPAVYAEEEKYIPRGPGDIVEGGYTRRDVDIDFFGIERDVHKLDGVGLVDMASTILKRDGELSVLDAGCGTGQQMYSLVAELTEFRGIERNTISAVGISDIDFTKESQKGAVREAVAEGDITYGIGDLQSESLTPEQFSLIYSYELLVRNEDPAAIVRNLWSALKPGGVLYFNAKPEQRSQLANEVLDMIQQNQGEILFAQSRRPYAFSDPNNTSGDRDMYRIVKN